MRTPRGSDGEKAHGLLRGGPYLYAFATLLCAVALLAHAAAAARDLVVYGEPTLEKALKSVGFLWQARTGTRVNVFVAPTDLSYAQIDRGARCDLIFALAGAATDEAARAKIIQGTTISRALRNGLVLVGTEPGTGPTADASLADLSRLIAGKRLAIANPDRDPANRGSALPVAETFPSRWRAATATIYQSRLAREIWEPRIAGRVPRGPGRRQDRPARGK